MICEDKPLFIIAENKKAFDKILRRFYVFFEEYDWIPSCLRFSHNNEKLWILAAYTPISKWFIERRMSEFGKIGCVYTADEMLNSDMVKSKLVQKEKIVDFIKKTAPMEYTEKTLNTLLDKIGENGINSLTNKELVTICDFTDSSYIRENSRSACAGSNVSMA